MRNRNLILISLLVIALLPYFIICFYALPFADDFCYGWTSSANISFWQKFLNQYLLWNGRYTADILVNFHPMRSGKLLMYQFSLFASLLATPFVLFIFIKQILRAGGTNGCGSASLTTTSSTSLSITVALFITLFYLCYQPNITEGIYWFIGITNYHLGNLFLLLHLALLLQSFSSTGKAKTFLTVTSLILLTASIGFNEIAAALIPPLYLLVVIVSFKTHPQGQTKYKLFVIFFPVAFISSMFVFLSPGNLTRGSAFLGNHHLLHSLFYSSLQTIRFTVKWGLSIPFVALSLIVITTTSDFQNTFLKKFDWRIILVVLLFTVFTGSFLPYFATGILGQHRTINYVFFYFILLWIWLLISVSEKFLLYRKLSLLAGRNKIFLMAAISVAVIIVSGNGKNILQDFEKDNWKDYKVEFMKRQNQVISNAGMPILPVKNVPVTYQITDAKADSAWWVDKCIRKFYTETKIVLR